MKRARSKVHENLVRTFNGKLTDDKFSYAGNNSFANF